MGASAGGSATTGTGNTFIGVNDSTNGCGYLVTTGSKNTIIGGFSGNQGGFDMRTSNNCIVLSDGDGNPRLSWIPTGGGNNAWIFSSASSVLKVNASEVVQIDTSGSSGYGLFIGGATSSTLQRYYNTTNTTVVGSVSITASATSYNTSSDYRLKNITGPVTGEEGRNFIMSLEPEQGTWKVDGSKFVGFVAHKFKEVSPTSVHGEKDAVDENGYPIYQAMQASSPEVMANLVAHIKYLETRLAALENKL